MGHSPLGSWSFVVVFWFCEGAASPCSVNVAVLIRTRFCGWFGDEFDRAIFWESDLPGVIVDDLLGSQHVTYFWLGIWLQTFHVSCSYHFWMKPFIFTKTSKWRSVCISSEWHSVISGLWFWPHFGYSCCSTGLLGFKNVIDCTTVTWDMTGSCQASRCLPRCSVRITKSIHCHSLPFSLIQFASSDQTKSVLGPSGLTLRVTDCKIRGRLSTRQSTSVKILGSTVNSTTVFPGDHLL